MSESKKREISAIETILRALVDFGPIERERILKYANDWAKDPKTFPVIVPPSSKS